MDVQEYELTSDWCFSMSNKAYEAGDIEAGTNYKNLGSMWAKREQQGGKDEKGKAYPQT